MTVRANLIKLSTWRVITAATLAFAAGTSQAEDWQFSVTPYLWLPNIEGNGTTESPAGGGGGGEPSFEVGPVDYLEHLNLLLMAAGEARRGRWSARSDVIYINFSNERSTVKSVSGPGGIFEIPENTDTASSFYGLKAQATIGYWLVDHPKRSVEIFAGARYLDVSFKLDWEFGAPMALLPQSGHIKESLNSLDAIVGANARFSFGDSKWFTPLHADFGTGDAAFTWQLSAGLGYSFSWGDLLLVYRHLKYEDDAGSLVERLALSGPGLGASFHF
jgi:hypothetical protein